MTKLYSNLPRPVLSVPIKAALYASVRSLRLASITILEFIIHVLFLNHIFRLREKLQINSHDEEKPFLSHLDDLRSMLVRMALCLLASTLLCVGFSSQLMDVLRKPVNQVWDMFEQTHLPSQVDLTAWSQAKNIAGSLINLQTPQQEQVLAQLQLPLQELTKAVLILRGTEFLPAEQRQQITEQLCQDQPTLLTLVNNLRDSQAVLTEGSGKGALKMMSAFQPGEAFMLSIKLALYAGIVVSFPFLLYFLLQFIIPGLLENERRLLYKCLGVGFALFLAGTLFCYFIVLPRVLTFFYTYSLDFGISNEWRIGYYLSFATQLILLFGLAFELPVVVMPFVKLGVLTYDMMKATRRYAIMAIVILAAIITPTPDVMTMLLMALPMYALYELCIGLAWLHNRKEQTV